MPMASPRHTESAAPADLAANVSELRAKNDWQGLAALADLLPGGWGVEWLGVADGAAFALGQLHRHIEARDLLLRAYDLEATHRRASALAYVHYAALLAHKIRRPRLDEPEPWRKGFERWITDALRLKPDSAADRYRLGVYHATIQSRKDVVALRAFRDAIALAERGLASEGRPGGRLRKIQARALYGAARSAFRLGRLVEARRAIFACIRADRDRDHVEPVFKLFLAAKVLAGEKRFADAERALRLAAEAPHQGQRDFVFALLAEVSLAQGRADEAASWIELHVPPHHRKPYVWRLLGDCRAKQGEGGRALKLFKTALLKDHGGRHKTLVRIGRVHEDGGQLAEARRAYEQAADFRRRRHLSEDSEALEALARVCEREGDLDAARNAYARMAKLPLFAERAERELQRLAG
jgi:tetratricopeptide (TPR) repeat protein